MAKAVLGIIGGSGIYDLPGLGWEPEVWGGSVVWSALVGLGMTLLRPQPDPLPGQTVSPAS